jgi:hypothetical protein
MLTIKQLREARKLMMSEKPDPPPIVNICDERYFSMDDWKLKYPVDWAQFCGKLSS